MELWIRCAGREYGLIVAPALTTVHDLKELFLKTSDLHVSPSRLSLSRVRCSGSGIPTLEEEVAASASAPLAPPLTLASLGLSNGDFLFASVLQGSPSVSQRGSPTEKPRAAAVTENLQTLLRDCGLPELPDKHMDYLRQRFSSQLLVVATREGAIYLRNLALSAPKSTTLLRLAQSSDLCVFHEPLAGLTTSRSLFYRAFRGSDGIARLLKCPIADVSAAQREVDTWLALAAFSQTPPASLAGPLELIACGVRNAILMPAYACSLADVPRAALTPALLLRVASELSAALARLHGCGLGHNDVKASNVFLDAQGRAFLGDYGAVSRLGDPLSEFSPSQLPMSEPWFDAAGLRASAQLDGWLLLTTLLDVGGLLSPASSHPPARVHAAVGKAQGLLRELLDGLLEDCAGLWGPT